MSNNESKPEIKLISKQVGKTERNNCFLQPDSVNSPNKRGYKERYFLGFKLLKGNELWRWNTEDLEDVKF